jgi:hypothetical protein
MSSMSVNRCIAVAAHGRRCQQTTYRGGPYCWHHTQSRKVWAPSRVTSRRQGRTAQSPEQVPAAPPRVAEVAAVPVAPAAETQSAPARAQVAAAPRVAEAATIPAAPPAERIAAALGPRDAAELAEFLESGEGRLVVERRPDGSVRVIGGPTA